MVRLESLVIAAARHSEPFVPEEWHQRFHPHGSMLSEAVGAADIIFIGVSTEVDTTGYDGKTGKGTYSGDIVPETFLKGNLGARHIELTWQPMCSGTKAGSKHIFFIRAAGTEFTVVKAIAVFDPPGEGCIYWAYFGGSEATLQTIRLLVSPSLRQADYAATLIADLKQDRIQRQATAVWLACETLRPECLDPLLFAVSNHVDHYEDAVYGACRLDGERGARTAFALLLSHSNERMNPESLIFEAISAAKNTKCVAVIDQFGTEHPEYRASCAFAIREIDRTKLPDAVRRWRADGKHEQIIHEFNLPTGWPTFHFSADALLDRALSGKKVFDEREVPLDGRVIR